MSSEVRSLKHWVLGSDLTFSNKGEASEGDVYGYVIVARRHKQTNLITLTDQVKPSQTLYCTMLGYDIPNLWAFLEKDIDR